MTCPAEERPCMTSRHTHSSVRADYAARLVREVRGAVFAEYLVLVSLVAVVLVLVLVTLGPRIVTEYSNRRATLYEHSP